MADPFQAAINEIEKRAVQGLNATLKYTHTRAQKYAPVRAIFGRTRRGREFQRTFTKPGASVAEAMRTYRRHPISTAARFERFKQSLAPNRRIIAGTPPTLPGERRDAFGRVVGPTQVQIENLQDAMGRLRGQTRGHNNSLRPVVRQKGETMTGDYRTWRNGKLTASVEAFEFRGGKRGFRAASAELTTRGRYEVKTGRAAVAKIGGDKTVRVGGALRDSIVMVEAPTALERGKFIGYVRAGGPGVDYAKYQEFGTRHNRAHPFLRPALYESRRVLREQVLKAIAPNQFKARR